MSKRKSDGFASASEAKKIATTHELNSPLLSSSTSSKENRTLRRAGPYSSALPVSQVVSRMALDVEALKVIRLEAQIKNLQEDCETKLLHIQSLEQKQNEWMEEKQKLEQKESDIRQTQKAMEDFEKRLNKGKCNIEQQDQELKERETSLKEYEMSLREWETSLWTEEAALARKECEDADALHRRWKRARDYHITTIESEKMMRAEIKDKRKRLEEYEADVVRREEKNTKKLEHELHSLEARRKFVSLQQQLEKAEKSNADLLVFCETVGNILSMPDMYAREPERMVRAAERLVERCEDVYGSTSI
ncbi:hypothetical protein EV368DRAFT_88699 [Lentinula lateritia]|nr:hypothetical protein EV368DRAFT_88699 [Lentinula lateritia]